MKIYKSDIYWNYASTFLKVSSGIILLPLILNKLPAEDVGIWAIFTSIFSIVSLVDFGFSPSFTRNVTYVFSGVSSLKKEGIDKSNLSGINYPLLSGLIKCMQSLYFKFSFFVLLFLLTLGTLYISIILERYSGSHHHIYIAWLLLCIICSYNLYTLYYESLLIGKGLIKKSKQISIIAHLSYLAVSSFLIYLGLGLIAIVASQLTAIIINRVLSYKAFFKKDLKVTLLSCNSVDKKIILKSIYPNAIKIGLTTLGGFMVNKLTLIIGSFYICLEQIASYGIIVQIITVTSALGSIYTYTYLPKINNARVNDNNKIIKHIYIKGEIVLLITYISSCLFTVLFGDIILRIIQSNTVLLPSYIIIIAMIISLLEINHSIAANIILSKNEVPFFKASLISGISVVILLLIIFKIYNMGILTIIIVPGAVQLSYQNWKWPLVVINDLGINNLFKKNAKYF